LGHARDGSVHPPEHSKASLTLMLVCLTRSEMAFEFGTNPIEQLIQAAAASSRGHATHSTVGRVHRHDGGDWFVSLSKCRRNGLRGRAERRVCLLEQVLLCCCLLMNAFAPSRRSKILHYNQRPRKEDWTTAALTLFRTWGFLAAQPSHHSFSSTEMDAQGFEAVAG
jgi:ribosomal protein L24E